MYSTIELRFVKRDGKMILQQKWEPSLYDKVKMGRDNEWRDVPCEPEPPKTEREKVCDEITEAINKFYVEFKSTYSFVSALLDKIRNIRNKASF